MITVIRNDLEAKYTHDVYDIKIKEELPLYKLYTSFSKIETAIFRLYFIPYLS